jgi:hypothetical protein
MTTTFQRNALDISYNGWENYETWNVALWINNHQSLYNTLHEAGDYEVFLEMVGNASALVTVFVMMTLG